MGSLHRICRSLTRGVPFAFIFALCVPMFAQERKGNEEEQESRGRTDQKRPRFKTDDSKSVRLPLELEQRKTYTFLVTDFSADESAVAPKRDRIGEESTRRNEPDAESPDADRRERSSLPGAAEDPGRARRVTYRFDTKRGASPGETAVEVTLTQGLAFGSTDTQGAVPKDRSIRRGSLEERGGLTCKFTVGRDGEIRPDEGEGGGERPAIPREVKQRVALIFGQGLHDKPLKVGEVYGREALARTAHQRPQESRDSSAESATNSSKPRIGSSEPGAIAGDMNSTALDGLGFVFRHPVERSGKQLALFGIVEQDDRARSSLSPSSQSGQRAGEAAQAKGRAGGSLESGTFQQSHRDCGTATYSLEDGLLEQLSLTRSSRGPVGADSSRPGTGPGREGAKEAPGATRTGTESAKQGGLTLLILRVDSDVPTSPAPGRSTESPDSDGSN